jgi:hypothetical protein
MKDRKAVSTLYTIIGMMACLIIGFVSGYFIGLSHSDINLESPEHIQPYNQTTLSDLTTTNEGDYNLVSCAHTGFYSICTAFYIT